MKRLGGTPVLGRTRNSSIPFVPFKPNDLPNLQLWYHQDMVSSGVAVSQWTDKSGNNRHATQATAANQPTNDGALLNNHRGVRFVAASSQFLFHPYTGEVGTVFIVAATDKQNAHTSFAGADSANTNLGSYYIKNTQQDGLSDYALSNNANQVYGVSFARPAAYTPMIYAYEFISPTLRLRTTPPDTSSTTNLVGTRAAVVTTNGNPVIGAAYYNHVVVDFLTGIIYEFLFYTPQLPIEDYEKVYAYLRNKYQISV